LNELRRQGLGLAAISYDSPAILAAFGREHGITFPLLSDQGSKTIKRFGLLNPVAVEAVGPRAKDPALQDDIHTYVSMFGATPFMAGMALPGTFILDRNGRVKHRFFRDSYIERNTVSSIMVRLGSGAAPVAGTEVSGGHLAITTYPSDTTVAPGNVFSLVFDIKPAAGIHVYAPGATSYRVIKFALAPQPAVRALSLKYPASQTYFFKPLKEHVPVFEKPFTLVQDVALEGTPTAVGQLRDKKTITIHGTLEYQACNDKICFNPDSIPLSWTLNVRSLIFERPAPPR
jgi:peroxiredoxin